MKFKSLLSLFIVLLFNSELYSQNSTDLLIQKSGAISVLLGEAMTYTITISNSGITVNDAAFNDNFPPNISNATYVGCVATGGALCPSSLNYTINNTSFNGTIPTLPHASSVTFTININAPTVLAGATSISNTATVSVPSGIIELDPTTNSSTWNTTVITDIDIETTMTTNSNSNFTNCTNYPYTIDYSIMWTNNGPLVDNNTNLVDLIRFININDSNLGNAEYNFPFQISNIQWASNNSSTILPTSVFSPMSGNINIISSPPTTIPISSLSNTTIPIFNIGDTITLNYSLTINYPTVTGCSRYFEYDLCNLASYNIGNIELEETNNANNSGSDTITNGSCNIAPVCPVTDIETIVNTASVPPPIGDCQNFPYSVDYEIKWTNLGFNIDSNTLLLNSIYLSNIVPTGLGNTVYQFPVNITNLQWSSNNVNTILPTAIFNVTSFNLPTGSISSIVDTLPVFYVGDTITLTYTLTIDTPTYTGCGVSFTYDLTNKSIFEIGRKDLLDTIVANNTGTDVIFGGFCDMGVPTCSEIDIEVIVNNTPDSILPSCMFPYSVDYEIKWINNGPSQDVNTQLNNFIFIDNVLTSGSGNAQFDFPYEFSNVQWQSSSSIAPTSTFSPLTGTVSIPGSLSISNFTNTYLPLFSLGDTITLSYTLTIDTPDLTGCGNSYDYRLSSAALFTLGNDSLIETNLLNNNDFGYNEHIQIEALDLAISESISPAIVNHLDTTEVTVVFQNASDVSVNNVTWSQYLPIKFEIIPSTISCNSLIGSSVCGAINYDPTTRIISQTVATMLPNSSIEIKFKGIAISVNTTTVNLEVNALINCIDCIPSTNFAQTTFQIDGLCELAYAGAQTTNATNCTNATDGSATIFTSGLQIGNIQYQWEDSAGNILVGQDSATATDLSPGVYTVTVFDDGVIGCYISEDILVLCSSIFNPTAVNDSSTTTEEVPVIFNILINDSDLDGIIDSATVDLNFSLLGLQDSIQTVEGLWFVDFFGNITFVPAENYTGTASILYTVYDNDGLISNTAIITVVVTDVNDPPILVNDTVTIFQSETIEINVLENDSDFIDSLGSIDSSSVSIVVSPENGNVEIDSITGVITYIPDSNFYGLDSFLYIACDNGNPPLCDSAWVYINVLENNVTINTILAVNDTVETAQNTAIDIIVLQNDEALAGNIDSSSVYVIVDATNGYTTVNIVSGEIIYTPNNGFFGVDEFQYVVCTDSNLCDTATVYIIITQNIDCKLKIPDAFTPNNDMLNETFHPLQSDFVEILEFRIYNRWGELIHHSIDAWDGMYNGKKQAADVYIYYLNYSCNGKEYFINNSINLIR